METNKRRRSTAGTVNSDLMEAEGAGNGLAVPIKEMNERTQQIGSYSPLIFCARLLRDSSKKLEKVLTERIYKKKSFFD